MDKEQVLKLAKLARIEISDAEAESLAGELGSILGYVGEVKTAASKTGAPEKDGYALRNVMREDGEGHEPGIYTEKILNEAPAREGDYVKVKKILE